MEPFGNRAEEMGLDISQAAKGMYAYRDRFSEVIYRQLFTQSGEADSEHPTDNLNIPYLGVFIKDPDAEEYSYAGYVSNMYKFVGNIFLLSQ